ncbi:hypothetical protein [Deferrisoma sp.]
MRRVRVAWVGEEQGWRPVLEAAGLEVVPGTPEGVPEADVVVCWGPWPAGLPWPPVPVVWCPAGACGTPGAPAARADVILPDPVRAVDLLRGVEEAVGLRLARLL